MLNRLKEIVVQGPVLWVLALAVLAVNCFDLGPWVLTVAGEGTANFVYLLIRILTFLVFPLLLVGFSGYRRFRALSVLGLLVAVEHLGFQGYLILTSYRANPGQFPNGLSGPLFGLFMSYIVFLPLILLVGFLGASLGARRPSTLTH